MSLSSFKIKIIDFGLARFYSNQDLCVLFGTPEFVSPEVISYDPVSPAADMWSLGVICYVMQVLFCFFYIYKKNTKELIFLKILFVKIA